MDQDLLLALARYNAYANRLLFGVVQRLSQAEYQFESQRSHSSVEKMLRHMLGTERGFLALCQGRTVERAPQMTAAEAGAAFAAIDAEIIAYITGLSGEELECKTALILKEQPLELPVWQYLVQVFVHATHHRGELSILLTELGFPLPTMDIIIHFVEESGQTWPL